MRGKIRRAVRIAALVAISILVVGYLLLPAKSPEVSKVAFWSFGACFGLLVYVVLIAALLVGQIHKGAPRDYAEVLPSRRLAFSDFARPALLFGAIFFGLFVLAVLRSPQLAFNVEGALDYFVGYILALVALLVIAASRY